MQRIIRTSSAEETQQIGWQLGRRMAAGMVLGLCGDLGAGKTCLVKGVATGLGLVPEDITSPTFTLMAEHYRGRIPLYHIDLYRLEGVAVEELGFEEYLCGQGVAAIEWFQFLPDGLIEEHLQIVFEYGAGDERTLTLMPYGGVYERLIAQVSPAE